MWQVGGQLWISRCNDKKAIASVASSGYDEVGAEDGKGSRGGEWYHGRGSR